MIMIKGVHEGAPRAELDAWLEANGLRDSRWYMAEPRPYVENGHITIVQVDTPKVDETGFPIKQMGQGGILTLVTFTPVLVMPPDSIVYRATS